MTKKKRGNSSKSKPAGFSGKKIKIASKNLTIYFMPWREIADEDATGKIKKILGIILQNKIIILQGKLSSEEETKLIENTMTLVGNIKGFQGIEIAAVSGEGKFKGLFDRIRHNIARILVGERDTVTIIGPANIVKDIKKDPKKIELMLKRN